MKPKLTLLISFAVLCFASGCFVPVNLNYESAKMLQKGDVELQGSYSTYFDDNGDNAQNDLGAKIGFGVSESYNFKFRFEYMESVSSTYFYIEADNKFSIKENKIAASVPLGFYFGDDGDYFDFYPKFYFTLVNKQKFDFTIIPKTHIITDFTDASIVFGISAGMGFSSNLNKWAVRPEIGVDSGPFFSFGIGFSYYFQKKKEETK